MDALPASDSQSVTDSSAPLAGQLPHLAGAVPQSVEVRSNDRLSGELDASEADQREVSMDTEMDNANSLRRIEESFAPATAAAEAGGPGAIVLKFVAAVAMLCYCFVKRSAGAMHFLSLLTDAARCVPFSALATQVQQLRTALVSAAPQTSATYAGVLKELEALLQEGAVSALFQSMAERRCAVLEWPSRLPRGR